MLKTIRQIGAAAHRALHPGDLQISLLSLVASPDAMAKLGSRR